MVVIFALYKVAVVASLSAILMFAASVIVMMERNKQRIMIPYATIWFLVLILFGALSGMWAKFLTAYNISFISRLMIILLTTTSVSVYIDERDDLERIMSMFLCGAVIIALLEFSAVPSDGWKLGSVGHYFSGNNPNDITLWMDFAMIIAFYRAYINNKKSMYLIAIMMLIFCAFSSSRKGLLAAIAGPLMIVFLSVRKRSYPLRIALAVILSVLLIMLVMENDLLYSAIGKRMDSMFDFLKGDQTDGSMGLRKYYISVAKEMFKESPLIGKGMGNFSRILATEYSGGYFYSHNNYWQILSELGLIGFFIYYSMYAYCMISFLKSYFTFRSKLSVLFLTALTMMFALDSGIISYCSKYAQLVLSIIISATYSLRNGVNSNYISADAYRR